MASAPRSAFTPLSQSNMVKPRAPTPVSHSASAPFLRDPHAPNAQHSTPPLPSTSSNSPHHTPTPTPAPAPIPSAAPTQPLKRAPTVGPFTPAPAPKPVPPRTGLINFKPNELTRDFPHLARGSYGVVFKGWAKGIQDKVVIKDMEIQNQRSVDEWRKEIAVMNQNRSPYIAEIYGFSNAGNILTIVMEYFPRGDLYTILHKKAHLHPLSMLQRMRMARHVALGLRFLHNNRIIHRDMKSMNILVSDEYSCKLTDFGTAKLVASDRQMYNTVNSGTPLWMAPEVKGGVYNLPADVYSLGLVLYEIFEGKLPAYDQVRQKVMIPRSFQSASVVLPCLNHMPAKRPTSTQVVTVLDKMINNVVASVKKQLPQSEQDQLAQERGSSNVGGSDVDEELLLLYRKLLTKPPSEVDALINKAFGSKPTNTSSSNPSFSQQHPRAPSPAPAPASTPAPSYGVPVGHPPQSHAPPPFSFQRPAPTPVGYAPGYVPRSGYPPAVTPTQQYAPSYQNGAYPPGYVASSGFPPGYTPQSAPPPASSYTPNYGSQSGPPGEIDRLLDNCTLSDLQSLLTRHSTTSGSSIYSKSELVRLIKLHCPQEALRELKGSRPLGNSYGASPSSATASSAELANSFRLYALPDNPNLVPKEGAILCLQHLLHDKMEGETLRETAGMMFETYDRSHPGLIDLNGFLAIRTRLLEMCL
eukprot:TRINITY_DN4027_c0_g1_i1.p1 TRINITY_DN4027_c0_g1~~TRINITY_DN4027_c0_g1_i1.p1  ORF type:complete len:777 (+),score=148.30 TRINITY_DN4027_c0_g1_i1:242-2332(+)